MDESDLLTLLHRRIDRRSFLRVSALGGMGIALFSGTTLGCASPPTPAPSGGAGTKPGGKEAGAQAKRGGILKVANTGEPPDFDTHQNTTIFMWSLVSPAYSGIVQYDPETFEVVPDLARSWEVSKDRLMYTFNLREGVKFHDGKPCTSEDARFSLDRIVNPPKGMTSPRKDVFSSVDKIEAPDPKTLRVTLKYPHASFLALLAVPFNQVFPKHVILEKGDMKKDVVGTGPFRFKKYTPGVSFELERNPDYFIEGLPYLDGIIFYIIKDPAAHVQALRTGQVHLPNVAGLKGQEVALLKSANVPLVYEKMRTLNTPTFGMNVTKPPFNDVRVRRAMFLAIDRDAVAQVLEDGEAELGGYMPTNLKWGFTTEELRQMPGYRLPKDQDVAEAKKLLAEAGITSLRTTLITRTLQQEQDGAAVVKDQLAKIGVDVQIQVVDAAAYYAAASAHNFEMHGQYIGNPLDDPDQILGESYLTGSGRNYEGWSNKEFDDLYAKQTRTEDEAERKKMVRQMQEILTREVPRVPMIWATPFAAWWPQVHGTKPQPGVRLNGQRARQWLDN